MNTPLRLQLRRWQRAGLVAAAGGLGLCGLGAAQETERFFLSYLFGFMLWFGLGLGCLEVAMIHYLAGGRWGFVSRRILEAGFMTLPLMAALFLPLLAGLASLYPWARPEAVAESAVLQRQQAYLNPAGFTVRAVCFFALWTTLATLLRRWSLNQDATPEPGPTRRMRALSGPGVVLCPLAGTFGFIDWIMSLEPGWYSTIFPVIVLIGQILAAFAFVILLLAGLRGFEPFLGAATPDRFHSLGSLLATFVLFWTYVAFSQLLVVYSGNLPHEIHWYLHRIAGSWKWVAGALGAFHFGVPFFLLLFRGLKRRVAPLGAVAALVFCMHVLAVYWTIMPSHHPQGAQPHWLDLAALVGVGGAWVALFCRNLAAQPVLPRNDPRLVPEPALAAHVP